MSLHDLTENYLKYLIKSSEIHTQIVHGNFYLFKRTNSYIIFPNLSELCKQKINIHHYD